MDEQVHMEIWACEDTLNYETQNFNISLRETIHTLTVFKCLSDELDLVWGCSETSLVL